jgi:hypothetical protein
VHRRLRILLAFLLVGLVVAVVWPVAEAADRRAVRARKALRVRSCPSCNPGSPVELPPLLGTYDVAISGSGEGLVGEIREEPRGVRLFVRLGVLSYLDLGLSMTAAGGLALDGLGIFGGDVLVHHEGAAQLARTAEGTTITGVLRARSGGERQILLTRPAAGVSTRLGGRYDLTFCDGSCLGGLVFGTTSFDLEVTGSGLGVLTAATFSSPDGDPLGSFGRVDCRISPRGAIDCGGPYEPEVAPPEPLPQAVRLLGRLGDDEDAQGVFLLGVISPPFVRAESGGWIAVRR